MFGSTEFADRREAGKKLADEIAKRGVPDNPLILAMPRGGVPVAYEIAAALGAPLDLLLVRKIGAPGHPEYGIGAVVDGKAPQRFINKAVLAYAGASERYVEEEAERQLAEIDRRRHVYMGEREAIDVKDRNVILVDDGIATGGTVRAALKGLRSADVHSILLAVPVAPPDVIAKLRNEVDSIVCLAAPTSFRAVGAHYADFRQTSDAEVIDLLEKAETLRT
jgi:putative phosphoribosyl transferase